MDTSSFSRAEAERPDAPLRAGLATLKLHWPEYLIEAALLGTFMISACVVTVLLEHPASPMLALVPSPFARRVLAGMGMALTAILLIYSAWGKRSGAHMNPAMTLTFLRLAKIAPWDAAFYVAAQFIGGLGGAGMARLLLGSALAHPNVRYAATTPGAGGVALAFAGELVISCVLAWTILQVSNHPRFARFTGLIAGALIASYISFEAPLSGMSMNPARTLGSAATASIFDSLWLYFVAPPLGMLLGAEAYLHIGSGKRVHCAKLRHSTTDGCIFRCRYADLSGPRTQA
jgi:aquaporin Z